MQERTNGVGGKLCAVKGSRGQAAEGLGKRFRGDGARFGKRAAVNLLRQERGAGDGGGAAAAKKACFCDASVHDASRNLQDVAADRIAYLDCTGGITEFAHVARIAKVLENSFAEHS